MWEVSGILEVNTGLIYPKQPYFVTVTSRYYKAEIMNYGISHFYCFHKDDIVENCVIAVPDGCIDILFCCDEKEPYANVCGTVLHPTITERQKGNHFFGVRFLPGNSFKFKDTKMSDFIERQIPLLEVMDDKELFLKITSSKNFNDQIHIFMNKYLEFYKDLNTIDKYKDLKKIIMEKIINTHGQIKVKELADTTGYSPRYIHRVFSEEFGLAPKVFCKLMRFQYLLNNLNNFSNEMINTNLTQLAIELGYYDQSHMMKDFYKFTNTTSRKYVDFLKESEYKNRIIII